MDCSFGNVLYKAGSTYAKAALHERVEGNQRVKGMTVHDVLFSHCELFTHQRPGQMFLPFVHCFPVFCGKYDGVAFFYFCIEGNLQAIPKCPVCRYQAHIGIDGEYQVIGTIDGGVQVVLDLKNLLLLFSFFRNVFEID